MVNVSQLKKIINSDFKGGSGSVTLLLWFKDLPLKDKEMLKSYFEFLKK